MHLLATHADQWSCCAGGSLESIARAKAGIMKAGIPAVIGHQPEARAQEVICNWALIMCFLPSRRSTTSIAKLLASVKVDRSSHRSQHRPSATQQVLHAAAAELGCERFHSQAIVRHRGYRLQTGGLLRETVGMFLMNGECDSERGERRYTLICTA